MICGHLALQKMSWPDISGTLLDLSEHGWTYLTSRLDISDPLGLFWITKFQLIIGLLWGSHIMHLSLLSMISPRFLVYFLKVMEREGHERRSKNHEAVGASDLSGQLLLTPRSLQRGRGPISGKTLLYLTTLLHIVKLHMLMRFWR
jgi:hypothetical protein